MGVLDVNAGLDLPHLDADHRLRRVLDGALRHASAGRPTGSSRDDDAPLFTAAHFGLDRVPLFRDADEPTRRAILVDASAAVLTEAYFIEKLGLAYGAKMVLLAETTEERMLYALFAADEARHLALVAPWLSDEKKARTENPFHLLLAHLIEEGDRAAMVFLIQVVLEGWGITHYRGLEHGASAPLLAAELKDILVDEARHHGSGNVLFEERGLTPFAARFSKEVLAELLSMVRIGPRSVLDAVDRGLGGIGAARRREVLASLDGPAHAGQRLALLRDLMGAEAARPLVDELAAHGLFTPLPVEAAA